ILPAAINTTSTCPLTILLTCRASKRSCKTTRPAPSCSFPPARDQTTDLDDDISSASPISDDPLLPRPNHLHPPQLAVQISDYPQDDIQPPAQDPKDIVSDCRVLSAVGLGCPTNSPYCLGRLGMEGRSRDQGYGLVGRSYALWRAVRTRCGQYIP